LSLAPRGCLHLHRRAVVDVDVVVEYWYLVEKWLVDWEGSRWESMVLLMRRKRRMERKVVCGLRIGSESMVVVGLVMSEVAGRMTTSRWHDVAVRHWCC
jgi:hypothetical protein